MGRKINGLVLILSLCSFTIGSRLPDECLNVHENVELTGMTHNFLTQVDSLVDCHRFCRLQGFQICSTYVYNEYSGECKVYDGVETMFSEYSTHALGIITIRLEPDCFDEETVKANRRRRQQPTGGYGGPPPTGAAQWTQWAPWSQCTALCGGGNTTRTRTCPTANQCSGQGAESKVCNPQSCCTNWSKWKPCSVTCGTGTQTRTQRCMVEDHSVPSGYASKENKETQNCTGAQPSCAAWSNWQPWAGCPVTCGGGQQPRTRNCGPSGSGCAGPASESQACNTNPCPEWTQWTPWTQCSDTCGGGWQIRTRNCTVENKCAGDPKEKQLCNVEQCPEWGEWEAWGECTQTCGNGTRTRNRPCINDEAVCVGANATLPVCVCPGAGVECHQDEPCNTQSCADWTEWTEWTQCSDTCGGGWQIRTRNCTVENMCGGDPKEKRLCNEQECDEGGGSPPGPQPQPSGAPPAPPPQPQSSGPTVVKPDDTPSVTTGEGVTGPPISGATGAATEVASPAPPGPPAGATNGEMAGASHAAVTDADTGSVTGADSPGPAATDNPEESMATHN